MIDEYDLIRSDHPSDLKKQGVCMIKQDDIWILDNCLVREICSHYKNFF